MAKKQKDDKTPKADKGQKAGKGQRSSLMEKLTTLIMVLFFVSLALTHLPPG
jgi:hypothetical protein